MSFGEFLRKITLPVVIVSGFKAVRQDRLSPRNEMDFLRVKFQSNFRRFSL